jgi:hypothetical protein
VSEPARQLQHELQHDAVRHGSHKRKHSRINSDQVYTGQSFLQLEGGQGNAGSHDTKRRRSYDYVPNQSNPAVSPRSSKFVEGSMNDKVSVKPSSPYLRNEQAMEEYHNNAGGHQRSKSATQDQSDSHRASGIFRFGKAIVSAFNPVTSWFKGQQDPSAHQTNAKKEEQAKIKEAYAKLKKSGYKGTRSTIHVDQVDRRDGEKVSILDMATQDKEEMSDADKTPMAHKRYGWIFDSSEAFLSTTSLDTRGRSSSRDVSENESSSRRSFHNRRPSLQNLHKAASHLPLPQSKRRSVSPATFEVEQGASSNREVAALQQDALQYLSKEDLRKRKKLSKQVSDLESKLARARHELEAVTGRGGVYLEVDHVADLRARRPFIPGALPSLPSERSLNKQSEDIQDSEDTKSGYESALSQIQQRPTTSGASQSTSSATPKPKVKRVTFEPRADSESPGPTPPAKDSPKRTYRAAKAKKAEPKKVTKKRKAHFSTDDEDYKNDKNDKNDDKDGDYMPSSQAGSGNEDDEDGELFASSHGRPSKKVHKSSKLQKLSSADSPGSAEKKGRIWPKENLTQIYSAANAARNKSTTDLTSMAGSKEYNTAKRRGRPSAGSKVPTKAPLIPKNDQTSPNNQKNKPSRRSISPYPFSSLTKKSQAEEKDHAITVIPGADTDDGHGEKAPPVPPIPKDYAAAAPNPMALSGQEKGGRSIAAPRKLTFEGTTKTAAEKMQVKGKMSIADNAEPFEWPDDVF